MNKKCIFLISARKKLLKTCLYYLNQNYNENYNYPILIFYHGNKYDSYKFRESIRKINKKTQFRFHKITPKLPSNITKKDLFWNLDNPYAKTFIGRIGYLHANYFWNNFMYFKELKGFDYLMRIDDDSWFKNKIEYDLFDELDKQNGYFGTAYTNNFNGEWQLNTRVNLFDWIKDYVESNNIKVKYKPLLDSLKGERDNLSFHSLDLSCGNCNIYNRKMFNTNEWENYNNCFNKIAGGYRYRWGDCEVITLYAYIHLDKPLINFNLKAKNLYLNQLPDTKVITDKKTSILLFLLKLKNNLKVFLSFSKFIFKK